MGVRLPHPLPLSLCEGEGKRNGIGQDWCGRDGIRAESFFAALRTTWGKWDERPTATAWPEEIRHDEAGGRRDNAKGAEAL